MYCLERNATGRFVSLFDARRWGLTIPLVVRGVTQVTDEIWLVSFMHYDLGYFDEETYI